MIRCLFIFIFSSLCWGEALVQIPANESALEQEQNILVLVDLQGALFYPKAAGTKVASIQNQQVAEAIKNYKKQNTKILYLAEHPSEAMFWQNSIKGSHLPFEDSFSLSNEIFHGFEGSIPSCRNGVVLCQGQPLGEILGLVINQLWVWTQFSPQKILFYTTSKERGETVSAIGLRIGAFVEVNLVKGIIGAPPVPEVKEPATKKSASKISPKAPDTIESPKKKQKVIPITEKPKQPEKAKQTKDKVQVTSVEPLAEQPKELPQKEDITPSEPIKPERIFPPITIDESKLEDV